MRNLIRRTALVLISVQFISLLACSTPVPVKMVLKILEKETSVEAVKEVPPGLEMSTPGKAVYFPVILPDTHGPVSNLSLVIPPGPDPELYFHLRPDTWLRWSPPSAAGRPEDSPAEYFLTGIDPRELLGAALTVPDKGAAALPELHVHPGRLTASPEGSRIIQGLSLRELPGSAGIWEAELSTEGWSESLLIHPWSLELQYSFSSSSADIQESDRSLLLETEDGKTSLFDLFPKAGRHALYFQSEEYGALPRSIRMNAGAGFHLESIILTLKNREAGGIPEAIMADTGTILNYPSQKWRNPDYEFFRWNLYPEILQITTRNYSIQSRFFKRLAFYVEKPGFIGRLAPNSEIESLHGWNAHDYAPEDLAAFFGQARAESFPLNPEEKLLEKLLLEYGILKEDSAGLQPGKGAVVGTSLETFYEQRFIFMAHESFHGIYFISPEFRSECENFWNSLTQEEQNFWINFLSYRGYNVEEDRNLLINETAIYLLQQPPEEADDYFIGFITPRLLAARPGLASRLIPWLKTNPEIFSSQVRNMEERLYNIAGFTAGTIHDLLPEDRSEWKIFAGLKAKWFDSLDDQS